MNFRKDRIVHRNHNFFILSRDGSRDYRGRNYKDQNMGEIINEHDQVFTIFADREYKYLSDDVGKMAYFIIVNKMLDGAAKVEARTILRYIKTALKEQKERIQRQLF